jgi:hypothetical protein
VYKHRLKNAFFTAAKNTTLHNPDSHLTEYYRSLRDRGLPMTEVYKRVGCALVRPIYRGLMALNDLPRREGATATDQDSQEAKEAPCNVMPSDTE